MRIASIILAAGKGTRIKSKDKNKVTLPFLNKPMIVYAVDFMSSVSPLVVVVVGAFYESVIKSLKDYQVIYAYQKKRLGTGHAVKIGLQALTEKKVTPKTILVGYGDHMMFYNLNTAKELLNFHKRENACLTLVTTVLSHPKGYGRIVRDKDGNVTAIVEEKDANDRERKIKEINAGLYCFDFAFLKKNISRLKKSQVSGEYYITDLVKEAYSQNKKAAGFKIPFTKVGIGVNKSEELEESQKLYLSVSQK